MNSNPTSPKPDSPLTLFCAPWVAPMDQPAFRDGAVLTQNNKILAVGKIADLKSQSPSAKIIDLPGSILLPGLVNAHTHLELTNCKRTAPPPGGFVQWIIDLMKQTFIDESNLPAIIAKAVEEGVRQCLSFGVTTVGDISRQCHLTRPLLKNYPLRVVSYGEVQAMAQRRNLLDERMKQATDKKDATENLTIGISPHAPYSIEPTGFKKCLATGLPFATHLSETPFEKDFLNDHKGPFRDLWTFLNKWDQNVPTFPGTPIEFAATLGILDRPTLLAHVNYCTDNDLDLLKKGKASIVYCPRTHCFFGHPPHRWQEMLTMGINVAIGTDSCASSPDLNLVDDLRLIKEIAPAFPADKLWQLATIRAAKAITLQNETGSLTTGKRADIIAFPAISTDPLNAILTENLKPTKVFIASGQSN